MIIVGSEQKMKELVERHRLIDKESGLPEMDFNTIKEMPKELEIEYGTKSHDGVRLYLAKKNPNIDFYGSKEDKLTDEEYQELKNTMEDHERITKLDDINEGYLNILKEKYKDGLGKVERLGQKCVENVKKYGAMNWYEWSIANWGTKWNASDTNINGAEMTFDTAWDPAIPAMVEMSRQYPEMPIAMMFADEQTGAHTGYVLMKSGNIDESGSFKDFSVDAYKLAFRAWGNADEYHYDEDEKIYVRNDLEHDGSETE